MHFDYKCGGDGSIYHFLLFNFQRRTSREGLINAPSTIGTDDHCIMYTEAPINEIGVTPSSTCAGAGSTDPLLQIPDGLSAVLSLKRGVQNRSAASSCPGNNLGGPSKKSISSTANSNSQGEVLSSALLHTPLSLKKKRESIV